MVIILTRELLFTKKLGLKLGFSRFSGFVIVGSQQMSAACCDVGYGEDCSICPKSTTSRYKVKAVLFRILFSSMNCVQPFQFTIIYCSFEKQMARKKMSVTQILRESGALNKQGFQYFKLCSTVHGRELIYQEVKELN